MSRIKSRLKRLEAVACPEPPCEVIVAWPDQSPSPPLKPGWHPDLGVFQLAWPEDRHESLTLGGRW